MIPLSAVVLVASAVELTGGLMLEDGYRPGARVGAHWALAEAEGAARGATHTLSGGPDLATYVVPSARWATLPGGTLGYRRTGSGGFRLSADVGAAVALHKYTVPTYEVVDGELEEVRMAGTVRWAPSARLGVGVAPTEARPWGAMFRPGVFFETPRNQVMAPVLVAELAGVWRL